MKENVTKKEAKLLRTRFYRLEQNSGFGGIKDLIKYVRGKTYKIRESKLKKWLLSQPSYAVHFPIIKKKYPRQYITTIGIDEQWEADLMFLSVRKKPKPVLVIVDCFSKRCDARIIRKKIPEYIINAFEDILENSPYLGRKSSIALKHPAQLRTDQGKEFKNRNFSKFLKKENIHHFYALNPDVKAAMVERLIRTLKNRLNKFLTHTKKLTFNSHDQCQMVLKKLIHSYNHRIHTSLGIAPIQVNLKTQDSACL